MTDNKALSKDELAEINQARCLPILLPRSAPPKSYSEAACLTLRWNCGDISRMVERFKPSMQNNTTLVKEHARIIRYYLDFMDVLNQQVKGEKERDTKKLLRKCYKNALLDFGVQVKDATPEQQYKACLLGTLLFVKELQENNDPSTSDVVRAIPYVRKYLGQEAKLADFADFVRQSLQSGSPYHKMIFYQDKRGIYLKYKEYWPLFQRYCQENGVVLLRGAASFRREILRKYITPQYQPANAGKYPRFDYRKKVEDKEETVLNVLPSILKIYSSD